MRVGILGGSFNPIHAGHVYIGGESANAWGLDTTIFVPNWNNPLSPKELAPPEARLEMVEETVLEIPRFSASNFEIARREVTYSLEVIKFIQSIHNVPPEDLLFIVGADAALQMDDWKYIKEFKKYCTIAVHMRSGYNGDRMSVQATLGRLRLPYVIHAESTPMAVSSTQIRNLIQQRKIFEHLVSSATAYHIKTKGLYGYVPDTEGY